MPDRFSRLAAILILVSSLAWSIPRCQAQQTKKPFTVADEIVLTLFGNPDGSPPELHFSPDGQYFAVWAERGQLDLNLFADSLRFYLSADLGPFLDHSDESLPPAP